jgi:parvulin-like peptidyl-prolyl isomerase
VEEEAFRLKPGELSGIVAVEDKFIIMKCLGRTQPVVHDMSEVRDELFREIHEQKLRAAMNREFDRLRRAATIQVFLTGVVKRGVLPASTPSAGVN